MARDTDEPRGRDLADLRASEPSERDLLEMEIDDEDLEDEGGEDEPGEGPEGEEDLEDEDAEPTDEDTVDDDEADLEDEGDEEPEDEAAGDELEPGTGKPEGKKAPAKPATPQSLPPLRLRVDQRDVEFEGSFLAPLKDPQGREIKGYWIPEAALAKLHRHLADPEAVAGREKGYRNRIAELEQGQGVKEARAEVYADYFDKLVERINAELDRSQDGTSEALNDFLSNYGRIADTLVAKADAAEKDAKLKLYDARQQREQQETDEAAFEQSARQEVWDNLRSVLVEPEFAGLGLTQDEAAEVYHQLMADRAVTIKEAVAGNPFGFEPGTRYVDIDAIRARLRYAARLAATVVQRRTSVEKRKAKNRAALGQQSGRKKAPPPVKGGHGASPTRRSAEPQNREEWEKSIYAEMRR